MLQSFTLFVLVLATSISTFAESKSTCVDEAQTQYRLIIDHVALENNPHEIDTPIRKLRELNSKQCFQASDFEDYYLQYFNPINGTTGEFTERKRKIYWADQETHLEYLRLKASSHQLSQNKKALSDDFKFIQPENVSTPVLADKTPYTEAEKAAACKGVLDIAAKLPPIRDQGATGWCYVYATADLLSFVAKKNISASYLGHLLSSGGSGGKDPSVANDFIKKFGLCREDTMPSNGLSPSYVESLQKLDDFAISFKKNERQCPVDPELLSQFSGSTTADIASAILSGIGPDNKVSDLGILDYRIDNKNHYARPAIVQHIALQHCAKDRKELLTVSSRTQLSSIKGSSLEYMNKIDQELSFGKPINFSYKYLNMTRGTGGGDHWSTVVGRRFIDGECQYQIRNSWGASSCTKMISSLDACAPPGHYWVGAGDLFKAIKGVQFAN